MPSRPNSSGHGLSEATQAVESAGLVADRIELTAIALELLPLGRNDLGRSLRGEPFVGEHALGARDLLAKPLRLGLGATPVLDAVALGDDLEDPLLVAGEGGSHAAAHVDRAGFLDLVERVQIACEAV